MTRTLLWAGWACSEAQGGDVRQHIKRDVLCILGTGGGWGGGEGCQWGMGWEVAVAGTL